MTSNLAIACFVLSLLLCGCGGGGGGSNSSTTAATIPASTTRPAAPASTATTSTKPTSTTTAPILPIVWYMDEDSTGWGVDVDYTNNVQQSPGIGNPAVGRASPTPAELLQADFDASLGVGVVQVIDGSIPGGTAMHSLQGLAPELSPLATRLAALSKPANVVMTNFEINDQYVLGEDVSTFTSWMQQWVTVVKAGGAVPVYAEPNPICTASMNIFDPTYGTNALVYAADTTFQNAGGTVLPNLSVWENFTTSSSNPQPWNIMWMSSDCVHPNNAGYAQKEKDYFPNALALVKTMLGQ